MRSEICLIMVSFEKTLGTFILNFWIFYSCFSLHCFDRAYRSSLLSSDFRCSVPLVNELFDFSPKYALPQCILFCMSHHVYHTVLSHPPYKPGSSPFHIGVVWMDTSFLAWYVLRAESSTLFWISCCILIECCIRNTTFCYIFPGYSEKPDTKINIFPVFLLSLSSLTHCLFP